MTRRLLAALLAVVAFTTVAVSTTPAAVAVDNGGGYDGGGGGGSGGETPDKFPNRPPAGNSYQPCYAKTGRVDLWWNNGDPYSSGTIPGTPYAPASSAAAWAAIGGGWDFQTDLYGTQYASLMAVNWRVPGWDYIVWDDTNPDGYTVVCTEIVDGNPEFLPEKDASMPTVVLDEWCTTRTDGSLQGPYARDNTTELEKFATFTLFPRSTTFGQTGDWTDCIGAQTTLDYSQQLREYGRYIGPVNFYGEFIVAVYWPGNSRKFGWSGPDQFRFGPLGQASLDTAHSLRTTQKFLVFPGFFTKNCKTELTMASGTAPGTLSKAQVRYFGGSRPRQPLYTGALMDPNNATWPDADPGYYTQNFCGGDRTPSTPNLTLRCENNRQSPAVTLADGVTRRQTPGTTTDVRADNKATSVDWMPANPVNVSMNAPQRYVSWLSRFDVPTAGTGHNSPSLVPSITTDVNSPRQPYGTVALGDVIAQNDSPSPTWFPLNSWHDESYQNSYATRIETQPYTYTWKVVGSHTVTHPHTHCDYLPNPNSPTGLDIYCTGGWTETVYDYGNVKDPTPAGWNDNGSVWWREVDDDTIAGPIPGLGIRFAEASVTDRTWDVTPTWRKSSLVYTDVQTFTNLVVSGTPDSTMYLDPQVSVTQQWVRLMYDCSGNTVSLHAERVAGNVTPRP